MIKLISFSFKICVLPSDAALASPIPPKVRSHNAGHTPASLTLF